MQSYNKCMVVGLLAFFVILNCLAPSVAAISNQKYEANEPRKLATYSTYRSSYNYDYTSSSSSYYYYYSYRSSSTSSESSPTSIVVSVVLVFACCVGVIVVIWMKKTHKGCFRLKGGHMVTGPSMKIVETTTVTTN